MNPFSEMAEDISVASSPKTSFTEEAAFLAQGREQVLVGVLLSQMFGPMVIDTAIRRGA
jgi:hypothetical protein